jgi:lysozyme
MNIKAIELIKEFEELRLEAYLCPAGVWTIGWGHTKGVIKGGVIDHARAEEFLREDYKEAEEAVLSLVKVKLTDNQLGALTSFVFNLGAGNFKSSTLRRKVNTNPHDKTIRDEFMRWVYTKGKDRDGNTVPIKLRGLERRREAEADLYFS